MKYTYQSIFLSSFFLFITASLVPYGNAFSPLAPSRIQQMKLYSTKKVSEKKVSESTFTSPESTTAHKSSKHYPTEGEMFDIEKGPGHHLIDAIPKDIEDLGDKTTAHKSSKHYPTEGEMFDIQRGPSHHLIDENPEVIEDLGDKSVDVNELNELKVDAVIFTFLYFGILALLLFVVPFVVLPSVQEKF
jgi:hypothetical protein